MVFKTFVLCLVSSSLTHGIILRQSLSASGVLHDEDQKSMMDNLVEATIYDGYLAKAVWTLSARSIDVSIAWKRKYLPVLDDLQVHACGNNSRFDLGNITMGPDHFSLHGVYAAGSGGARSATSGEISVEGIEDILDGVIDGETYSPWMDNHFAMYKYDIESVISKFRADGQKFVVLSWDADGVTFYSVIARVPKSQEIYEFISPQKPANAEEIVRFPVARHFFGGRFQSQESDNRNVALHMSQTTRDLTSSLDFFKNVLSLEPIEQRTFDGGSYAIFDLNTDYTASEGNMLHGQLQLWERDDAKSGSYSPAWFEEYVEDTTIAKYTGSLTTCWNAWADNHLTYYYVPTSWIRKVVALYEERGLPYKEFSIPVEEEPLLFSAYFMLPGGRWLEVHPLEMRSEATAGSEGWDKEYCYEQSCR
mmetsp:Transcript_25022/g.65620  ORF Transcript_25022/g.65620 Transcript_25022/m.65620 type:complete len:421 (-) Transcript_25022:93-1355(-)